MRQTRRDDDRAGRARPPRLARSLLRRFLPGADAAWLLADLQERYEERRRRRGRLLAGLWYWRQTVDFIVRLRRGDLGSAGPAREGRVARPKPGARLDSVLQDLRFGVRSLRRAPGFAAVATLVLALGIGASVSVFSVVEAVLIEPLPYREPDRLVLLWHRTAGGADHLRIPAPDVPELRRRSRLFEGFAFTNRISDAALQTDRGAEHLRLGVVSSDFFSLLGVEAARGRAFVPGEGLVPAELLDGADEPDGAPAPPGIIVLGHGLWQRRFGGDPGVLGRELRVDGRLLEVVGVLPRSFELLMPPDAGLPRQVDAWTPLPVRLDAFRRPDRMVDQDSDNTGAVIGRLAPGVNLEQARAEMAAVAAALRAEIPSYATAGLEIQVEPMHRDVVAHARPLLLMLAGAVGFVLLIACGNVANLLLARSVERRREFAVRAALGAGRWRLVRQSLLESSVLGATAAALGLGLAWIMLATLELWSPAALPRVGLVGLDATAFGFAVAATVGATLVAGLAPALAWSAAATHGRGGSRAADPGGSRTVDRGPTARLRRGLLLAEVALSVLLLVGAGLMLRSFAALHEVDPGFDAEGVLAFDLSLRHPERYRGPADRARLVRRIEERLRALPGVEDSGLIGRLPLGPRRWSQPYGLPGQDVSEWAANEADLRMVTSSYFRTLGIRLLAGRRFTPDEDLYEDRRVVIVDRRMARRLAPGGDLDSGRDAAGVRDAASTRDAAAGREDPGAALGRRIGFPLDGDPVRAEVVGVVENVRSTSLQEEGRETIYVPYRQEASRDVSMVVRTSVGDPAALAGSVRGVLREIDRELPVYGLRPMSDYVAEAMAPTRFALRLVGVFAAVALVLATVGLYGVLAWQVGRRAPEIGLRVALGARPGAVARMILGEGLRLAVPGVVLGLAAAAGLARFLRGMLFEVTPLDPSTFVAVAVLVLATAVAACWVPARRASRVDPMAVLR